jgi:hypothetical protein
MYFSNKMYEQSMYLHAWLICFLQSWHLSDSEFNTASFDYGWKSIYCFSPIIFINLKKKISK